jgi:molecular chaperone GrpE
MDEQNMTEQTQQEVPETDTQNAELEALKAECDALNDKYLRTLAEYDNYRKRVLRERENTYADAYCDVLKEILPVADNLERAIAFTQDPQMAQGVEMTYKQLQEAFARLGIEEIPTETFDPNYHNAVMHTEDEAYGENAIVEVFQKGYKKGDRVLRFAMVKVAN